MDKFLVKRSETEGIELNGSGHKEGKTAMKFCTYPCCVLWC